MKENPIFSDSEPKSTRVERFSPVTIVLSLESLLSDPRPVNPNRTPATSEHFLKIHGRSLSVTPKFIYLGQIWPFAL
jgi:hypothetical protein